MARLSDAWSRRRDRLLRPRPALALGWMVMLVVVASDGLTLLSAASFINHSVPTRAQDLLEREQHLVRAAIAEGDQHEPVQKRLAELGRGFAGRMAFLPRTPQGTLVWGNADGLRSPDLVRRLPALHRPRFSEVAIAGHRWFLLCSPVHAQPYRQDRPGLGEGVLLLATPRAPLEQEAETEREGLIGTALLTLILLGYALVGVSQWLGAQLEHREARLADAKGELELALAHMSDGLCVFDRSNRLIVFNQQFCRILGIPPGTLRRGTSYADVLAASLAAGNHTGRDAQEVMVERTTFASAGRQIRVHHENQDGRTIEVHYSPTADGGLLLSCTDVTERLRTQGQIAYMAEHDPLTGLHNRAAFSARLAAGVASATRQQPLALLCLDLDHFKEINDTWGHPAGDQLLRTVADRMRRCLRSDDDSAYRLGGDEFAVLVNGIDATAAETLARRMLRSINQSCDLGGAAHWPRASIGIAMAPDDAAEPDRLMQRADMALYAAKQAGRNGLQRFRPELEQRQVSRALMEQALRRAIAEDQFVLWYQPIIALPSQRLVAFEALLRWQHPQRGLILPSEFVGVAERSVQIIEEIGGWVLRQACIDADQFPPQIRVAVNVSAEQLRRGMLSAQLEDALARSRIAPNRLELEVTETAIIQDPDTAFAVLLDVQRRGVDVALDDFGTGYSSLSFLTRFRFDSIKIDRSFIADMAVRADCAAIVEALSSLGTHLGLVTTAEGIESAEQLHRVGELGCRRAQGLLIGRAMPLREASTLARIAIASAGSVDA